jgi:phosphoribosylanthranilate isomerase
MHTPRVKICCIASLDEAQRAIEAGASALGLVSAMPSGPGPIDETTIATIAAAVPRTIDTFLLTCLTDADAIVEQHRRCGTTTLQLVDAVAPTVYGALRRALPRVRLVQVIHVEDERALQQAADVAPHVDALLLDSGRPSLAVKELGGTGRVHDWSVSRRIVAANARPVWLAGGLKPDNVRGAIDAVQPFGLDLCSGVRSGGSLDTTKLNAFFAAVSAH